MSWPKTIKTKLLLLLLSISLSIAASIGILSYYFCSRALKEQLLNSLTSIAESRETAILGILEFRLQLLKVLAANETVQNLMQEWDKREHGGKIDEMVLEERVKSFIDTELVGFNAITTFFDYLLIGENGKVYYSTDKSLSGADWSGDERFVNGMKKQFLTDVRFDSGRKRYFREMAVPIFSHQVAHEKPMGVIISKTGTEVLNEITTNRAGLGETGKVYVVNKDGLMITESRFLQAAILRQKVDTEPVRLFQSKKKVMAGIYRDYRNILVAGASMGDDLIQKFPELGWTVLAEMDAAEFLIPIIRLRNTIIIIGLLIFVVVSLIGLVVSGAITIPIKQLTQSVDKISQGDLTVNIPVKSSDEIGRLAGAFNHMADNLKKSFTSIDNLNREIDMRRKVELALRESEAMVTRQKEHLSVTLKSIGDGVIGTDTQGRITLINEVAEKLTGWTQEEAMARPLEEVFHIINEETRERCPNPVERVLESGQIVGLGNHTLLIAKDGTERVLDDSGSSIRDKDNSIIGVVLIFRDVTEKRWAQERLEKASQRLEKANQELIHGQKAALNMLEDLQKSKEGLEQALQAKSAFTSMVSHELRTPLAALKESVSQVLEGILGAINLDQKKILEIAKNNVDRLARLINKVLDFQTLESGKAVFKMEENDINKVVKEVREATLVLAEKKNLDFTLNLDENLPLVRFDRDKINQVLTNLVGNSIKLTEKGGIIISTGMGDNIVQVSVQDTGPGIKEEDMPRLFQQYEQLERKVGGTGLGLAISLEIIKAHGGKIWAESKFGQGTTFHFVLPVKERRIA